MDRMCDIIYPEKWINNLVSNLKSMLFIFEMVVSRRYKEQFFPLTVGINNAYTLK